MRLTVQVPGIQIESDLDEIRIGRRFHTPNCKSGLADLVRP